MPKTHLNKEQLVADYYESKKYESEVTAEIRQTLKAEANFANGYLEPWEEELVFSPVKESHRSEKRKAKPDARTSAHARGLLVSSSHHADIRQAQRSITEKEKQYAIKYGKVIRSAESITYVTDTMTLVTSHDGHAITVINNTANAKHDITLNVSDREKYLLDEVEKNNDSAMCELAELYSNEILGRRNVQKAYSLFLRAAELNNGHAMIMLAEMFEKGEFGKLDYEQAMYWYEKGAQRGNKIGLYMMAQHLLCKYVSSNDDMVDGVSKTLVRQRIKEYLDFAARKGGSSSIWLKALILEKGYFGEKKLDMAIELYRTAAEAGHETSIGSMQRLFLEGAITAEQLEIVLDRASEVVATKNSNVAVNIGSQQIYGLLGNNPQRGFMMLERAAANNNIKAMFKLAELYRNGIGCEIDLEASKYWGDKAEQSALEAGSNGNVKALWQLAHAYLRGELGDIRLERAEELFVNLVKNGAPTFMMLELGKLYIEGSFGDRDPLLGRVWIAKAIAILEEKARDGEITAINQLITVYLDKNLGFKDYKLAIAWLKVLATKADVVTLSRISTLLGDIYSNPKRDEFNFVEASSWYKKAAKNESSSAAVKELNEELYRNRFKIKNKKEICNLLLDEGEFRVKQMIDTIPSEPPEVLFRNGEESKDINLHLAAHNFRESAEAGYTKSHLELAKLFASGQLGERVRPVAMLFYKRAAKRGNVEAMQKLVSHYAAGDLSEANKVKAEKWAFRGSMVSDAKRV